MDSAAALLAHGVVVQALRQCILKKTPILLSESGAKVVHRSRGKEIEAGLGVSFD